MSNESRCNCRHCNGHIAFPTEMVGQSINCPHCQLETLLFIPPAAVLPKQPTPTTKNTTAVRLLVVAIILVACVSAVFFLRNSRVKTKLVSEPSLPEQPNQTLVEPAKSSPEQINLKPVVAAFGWKLGDQLPQRFKAELRDSDYGTTLVFTPQTEWPPFNIFTLDVTPDGRICSVHAAAVIFNGGQEDFSGAKERVVALLSEKYGLRQHNNADEPNLEEYDFGTVDQTARLQILRSDNNKQLWLEYYDRNLKSVADDAHALARAKDESNKKAALSKGL